MAEALSQAVDEVVVTPLAGTIGAEVEVDLANLTDTRLCPSPRCLS